MNVDRDVGVARPDGLIRWWLRERMPPMKAMRPAAHEREIAEPRPQGVDEKCQRSGVVHLTGPPNELLYRFPLDQVRLFLAARWVRGHVQPHLQHIAHGDRVDQYGASEHGLRSRRLPEDDIRRLAG